MMTIVFPGLHDFNEFASCVGPATHVDNTGLKSQCIITAIAIGLNKTTVALQVVPRHLAASTWVILIHQSRLIRRTTSEYP